FVLYDREFVLAHPAPSPTVTLSAQQPMPRVDEVGDPILARIWDAAREAWQPRRSIEGASGHRIVTPEGSNITFVYRTISDGSGHSYTIGTYHRGSLAEAEVMRLRNISIASLAVLVFCIAATVVAGRRVSKPIRLLAATANLIQERSLDHFQAL